MNKLIPKIGAVIVAVTVFLFAVCMIVKFHFGSYLVCMFLPIGYIMMVAGFQHECCEEYRVCANIGLVFSAIYAVLIFLVRPFARRVLRPKGAATNADRIIGQEALVTQPINNTLSQGEIKVFGQLWTARAADGGEIPAGSLVRVREIVGVKAIVEKIP